MKIRSLEGLAKAAAAGRNVRTGHRTFFGRVCRAAFLLRLPGWYILKQIRGGLEVVPRKGVAQQGTAPLGEKNAT